MKVISEGRNMQTKAGFFSFSQDLEACNSSSQRCPC